MAKLHRRMDRVSRGKRCAHDDGASVSRYTSCIAVQSDDRNDSNHRLTSGIRHSSFRVATPAAIVAVYDCRARSPLSPSLLFTSLLFSSLFFASECFAFASAPAHSIVLVRRLFSLFPCLSVRRRRLSSCFSGRALLARPLSILRAIDRIPECNDEAEIYVYAFACTGRCSHRARLLSLSHRATLRSRFYTPSASTSPRYEQRHGSSLLLLLFLVV